MKIENLTSSANILPHLKSNKRTTKLSSKPVEYGNQICYTNLAFRSKIYSPKFYQAKSYLEKAVLEKTSNYKDRIEMNKNINLYDFDLNKLEGLQEGIKIFEGMNFKEIAFFMSTLAEIPILRGCYNKCSYCYANAQSPYKFSHENEINRIDFEDYESLINGINTLNSRLGFYASGKNVVRSYITPFHDADCINITLKDNAGKELDFIDFCENLYGVTNVPMVFDTAGWTPKDKKRQKRAEKFVEYLSKPENKSKLFEVNISFNPFHILNTKSILLKEKGDLIGSERFRDLYTTRMANTMFTFTPLLKTGILTFLPRAFLDDENSFKNLQHKDLQELFEETIKKLKVLYNEDLNGDKKYIKTKKNLFDYINKYKKIYRNRLEYANITENLINNFNLDNKVKEDYQKNIKDYKDALTERKSLIDFIKPNEAFEDSYVGILDINGKFYLTNYGVTLPTEIKLNFKNKNKLTAPIEPCLLEDKIVKRSFINDISQ